MITRMKYVKFCIFLHHVDLKSPFPLKIVCYVMLCCQRQFTCHGKGSCVPPLACLSGLPTSVLATPLIKWGGGGTFLIPKLDADLSMFYLQLLDFVTMSQANTQISKAERQRGWHRIAWAFLKVSVK